jgi:hypothetical protein
MTTEDSLGGGIAFILGELIRPQRVIRYLVTATLLYFAYRETGGATVICLALTAIAIELNDAVMKWNNKVADLKYQDLQMGVTRLVDNTIKAINAKKESGNGQN